MHLIPNSAGATSSAVKGLGRRVDVWMGNPCQTQPEAEEDWGGGFNAICSPPAQWREREGALLFS